VIFSDASIPGEGEHKIMEYIRAQRNAKNYNPNTSHVLHGLDADLIMLALATHEVHFSILREELLFGNFERVASKRRKEETNFNTRSDLLRCGMEVSDKWPNEKPLIRLSIPILREYIMKEFKEITHFHWFDLERLIDDIVFLCFFVGNDFLPHLPSLDIREGALDFIFNIYKESFPSLSQGYITSDGGEVDLKKVNKIFDKLGRVEDFVFKQRHQSEETYKSHSEENKVKVKRDEVKTVGKSGRILNQNSDVPISLEKNKNSRILNVEEKKRVSLDEECSFDNKKKRKIALLETKQAMEVMMEKAKKEKIQNCSDSVVDNVRLHEPDWKERYYTDKCKVDDIEKSGGKDHLFRSYITGLCWVAKYYFSGVPSWKWYYPFHYAPFASDLFNFYVNFKTPIVFGINTPFTPIEQLMAVLPSDSSAAVPKSCRPLMHNVNSPIIDFYPKEVACDPNGKKMPWLWVVLLPFINEERLKNAMKPLIDEWSDEDLKRNKRGKKDGYIYISPKLAIKLNLSDSFEIFHLENFLQGYIFPKIKDSDGSSIQFTYAFEECKLNKSELLPNVILPKPVLSKEIGIGRPRLSRGFNIANLGSSPYQHSNSYNNYQNRSRQVLQPMESRNRIPRFVNHNLQPQSYHPPFYNHNQQQQHHQRQHHQQRQQYQQQHQQRQQYQQQHQQQHQQRQQYHQQQQQQYHQQFQQQRYQQEQQRHHYPSNNYYPQNQHHQQQQSFISNSVGPDKLMSLRSQLVSTLKKNQSSKQN